MADTANGGASGERTAGSKRIRLASGVEIPALGLGVWQTARGETTRAAVTHALRFGYRHIDTAAIYGNEADVGAAVRDSGVPRNEVFVTTKLWNSDQGYDRALRAFDKSQKALGLDVVDLYLVHWPLEGKRVDSYRALVRLREEGRVRAIGVSNFTARHLEELLASSDVAPDVNQIELSPFLQQREIVDFCRRNGIVLEAYSPLTRGEKLKDARLAAIAESVGKTPAQVLIRWSLQHGFVCLPKSEKPHRIEENGSVFDFELSPAQMETLDGFDEHHRTCWDPTAVA
jgi:diketogulonate reductase-like aldo/keto reductase